MTAAGSTLTAPERGVRAVAPRLRLPGVDILRVLGVVAVVYSHISFYFRDDRITDWWLLDAVESALVRFGHLNQHLSFLGVSIFLVVTGLLVSGSAISTAPGRYLLLRVGRLMPMFWLATALAVVLVWLGVNGTFGSHQQITVGWAVASLGFAGFFSAPEVVVLGVVWTLLAQIVFYFVCAGGRHILARNPIRLSLGAAVVQTAVIVGVEGFPAHTVPEIVPKIALALCPLFFGQILYLYWTKLVSVRLALLGVAAQAGVLIVARYASHIWGADRYLWTVALSALLVALIAKRTPWQSVSPVVRWIGTRSFGIYLLHTLILYRVYNETVDVLGRDLALLTFLAITCLAADVAYRVFEKPIADALNTWVRGGGTDRLAAAARRTVKSCRGLMTFSR